MIWPAAFRRSPTPMAPALQPPQQPKPPTRTSFMMDWTDWPGLPPQQRDSRLCPPNLTVMTCRAIVPLSAWAPIHICSPQAPHPINSQAYPVARSPNLCLTTPQEICCRMESVPGPIRTVAVWRPPATWLTGLGIIFIMPKAFELLKKDRTAQRCAI